MSLPKCTILDIDGTISEPCDRDIYDNIKCIDDYLQTHIYNAIKDVKNLIVCTGRSIDSSKSTLEWLSKHNINFTKIYFRNKNDYRPDWVVKEENGIFVKIDPYVEHIEHDNNGNIVENGYNNKKAIDNLKNSGTVKLDGMEWSAKSENGEMISEGETVEILRVEGVKAIVRKEKGE